MRQGYALGAAAVWLAACGAETHENLASVRDSAGIRIVGNRLGPVPAWHLTDEPVVSIGSATDSLASLYQVEGAHRLSDGRILVANRSSAELRYYDAGGTFIEASGRSGEGPGEYEYIAWTIRCGSDTTYVYDIGNRRLTVVDESGELVEMFPLMLPENTLPYGRPSCQPGGPFVSSGWAQDPPEPRRHRHDMPVGTAALDGTPLRMIGMFPGVDRWGIVVDGQVRGTGPLPLGRSLVHAITEDRIYVGTGDAYELAVYDLDGTLVESVRLAGVERSLGQDDIDRFIEGEVARAESDYHRRSTRQFYADMDFPDQLPAYAELLVDADGHLWVRDYPRPGATDVTWRIFDADGTYEAVVEMPATLRVLEIGPDYLVATMTDDLDVERVLVYQLARST